MYKVTIKTAEGGYDGTPSPLHMQLIGETESEEYELGRKFGPNRTREYYVVMEKDLLKGSEITLRIRLEGGDGWVLGEVSDNVKTNII